MADTTTTNYSFTKPEIDGSDDTWGLKLNVDLDSIDTNLKSVSNVADASLPKSGGAVTGAITTTSTFDGRDVGTDGGKLDGIESGATADQTNAQIKTAYEANANSNEFSDAEQTKLSGIATSANNYSLPSSVVHDTEKGALHATDALRLSGHTVSLYKGDGTSESVTIPDNNTTYSVGDGGLTQVNFTTADNTKLDGIATSANNYSLPTATASVYGGVKVSLSGTHLTITA